MGYQNPNSGNLREQRRAQRRQATSAPVGQTSIGHGDGLRVYDDGRIILDGEDLKIIFQILGSGGFITYESQHREGLRADPAFWGDEEIFTVAGPLRDESTAGEGFGGSNLFLYATHASLAAGSGGTTAAQVYVGDNGMAGLYGPHASIVAFPDGAVDIVGRRSAIKLPVDGSVSLNGLNAGAQYHADGAWQQGSGDGALMQAGASGGLGVWPGTGGMSVNGDFSVSGAKNFLMAHPSKPDTLLRYGSTESPVSAIECRGRVTIGDDGTAPVTLPGHFTAIIKPDTDVDMWLSPYGPDPAWCESPTTTGTTVHGAPGTVVAWTATAERIGGDFTVEEPGTLPVPPINAPEPSIDSTDAASGAEPPTDQETL